MESLSTATRRQKTFSRHCTYDTTQFSDDRFTYGECRTTILPSRNGRSCIIHTHETGHVLQYCLRYYHLRMVSLLLLEHRHPAIDTGRVIIKMVLAILSLQHRTHSIITCLVMESINGSAPMPLENRTRSLDSGLVTMKWYWHSNCGMEHVQSSFGWL